MIEKAFQATANQKPVAQCHLEVDWVAHAKVEIDSYVKCVRLA